MIFTSRGTYVAVDTSRASREVARASTLAAAKKAARDDAGRPLHWSKVEANGVSTWYSDDNYEIKLEEHRR